MKTPFEKYDDALIISRLQQIEIASIKPTLAVDSPFFHLITIASLRPFIDNVPINLGMEFRLIGNRILGVQINRGYFSHDLETELSNATPAQALSAIARLSLSPIFYQSALFAAYYSLVGKRMGNYNAGSFTIAMEFARVAHHFSVIRNVLHCLRLDSLAEIVLDCEAIIKPVCQTLSRIHIGNAPQEIMQKAEIVDAIADTHARALELVSSLTTEERLRAALQKKAVISMTQAGSMGLTGTFLQANRDLYDVRRQNMSGFAYSKPPRIAMGDGGDAFTRFLLRAKEIVASLRWLTQTFQQDDSGETFSGIVVDDNAFGDASESSAYGEVEGPEGDIKVSIFANSEGKLHFRVRSPGYFIAQAIPHMLQYLDLADVAVILFSLGITAEEVDK